MGDRRRSLFWLAFALLVVVFAGGIIARCSGLVAPRLQRQIPASASPPAIDIPFSTASIATIDDRRASTIALFRLDVDPAVLVLDFPDLHAQGQMLNRVAALIEKAGMPRDRVVTEAELDAQIRADGDTPDSYYYGHDYRAADLARFFALAAHEGVTLNTYESWLKARIAQEGWFKRGAIGALISIPGVSPDIDASARTTIFRHELSHAVYFTDPAYVVLTWHLWSDMLTEAERGAIRKFLGADGYDTADEDLMANEGQAYLIHTHDPRYFLPDIVGIDPTRETILRSTFIAAIPEAWLRESALAVAPITPTALAPAAAPAVPAWIKPVADGPGAARTAPGAPATLRPWLPRSRPQPRSPRADEAH